MLKLLVSFLIRRVRRITQNFYFTVGLIFVVWMLFFDNNNILHQFYLRNKLDELESNREFYGRKIGEVKNEIQELTSRPDLLEKFAREKYLFKRRGEDIYIIDED